MFAIKESSEETVWRADSWLFISATNGDVSLLMVEKTILAFAFFLRSITLHPNGHHFNYGGFQFHSDDIECFEGNRTVVVMLGGDNFVYTFAIAVDRLEDFASYLEDNSGDAEDA